MKRSSLERARTVLDIEAQAILAMKDRLDSHFDEAVEVIRQGTGKLIVSGIGKSGQIARKLASTFSSTGTPAVFLHPAEGSHGDLGMISQNDVVLMLSYGGEAPELSALLNHISRKGNCLIALTGSLKSSLAKAAKVVLDVSVAKEACPLFLAPTASSTATLAMGDALAMAVMEAKGFTAEQFAEYHPGGSLGFKLTRVSDNMHTGLGFVLVTEDTPVRKVFSLMSQKDSRGAAGIIGKDGELIGIITDGDIRRRLENSDDPLTGVASDMMTRNPRTVGSEEIAEKALFLMEQFRINLLFVLDSQSPQLRKPVGILHIQDLLKNKIR